MEVNTIIHGDCGKIIPPDADLFLTDPPYGISRDSGFGSGGNQEKFGKCSTDFGEWDENPPDPQYLALLAAQSLRKGGTAVIFCDWKKAGNLAYHLGELRFSKVRLIIWDKINPVPVNATRCYLSNAREYAVAAVKGQGAANAFNSYYNKGLFRHPLRDGNKNVHPTQKPLALMEQLVSIHSNPGDLVFDPYCGSGTTCLAAKKLHRDYLGIEINEEYVKAARGRLV